MERIASFSINHDILKKGMYISRIDFDDIVTYDIRMKEPNKGDYLSSAGAHTIEHLFATYARNTDKFKNYIVYVGPMGCRTGCYLITKGMSHKDALELVQKGMAFVANFEGEIPGAKAIECGNCDDHCLENAKKGAAKMVDVLKNWAEEQMVYPE